MENINKVKGVFLKLAKARHELSLCNLKMSGENSHQKYRYLELGDILPDITRIFQENNLIGLFNIENEEKTAYLTIVDCEDGTEVVFKTPIGDTGQKNQIQNIGATQTYVRRYLWLQALEISVPDEVDSSNHANYQQKQAIQPVPEYTDSEIEMIEEISLEAFAIARGDKEATPENQSFIFEKLNKPMKSHVLKRIKADVNNTFKTHGWSYDNETKLFKKLE